MDTSEFHKICRLGDLASLRSALSSSPWLVNHCEAPLGWTALYRTALCGHGDAMELLLEAGADANAQNSLGETALHQAADSGQESIAETLLKFGADPNAQQKEGETPLMYAVGKGYVEIIELLLRKGADPNISDYIDLKTALDVAQEKPDQTIVSLLLKHGAKKTSRAREEMFKEYDDQEDGKFESVNVQKGEDIVFKSYLETVIEPESENINNSMTGCSFSFGGDPTNNELYRWLAKFKLESNFRFLSENGFDDLKKIIEIMGSANPITDQVLISIGIRKQGHRAKLLTLLEREFYANKDSYMCCTPGKFVNSVWISPHIKEWLNQLQLGYLTPHFLKAGYEYLEDLAMLNGGRYAVNDFVLEYYVGIEKIGHRAKILAKLTEDVHKHQFKSIDFYGEEKYIPCKLCIIF